MSGAKIAGLIVLALLLVLGAVCGGGYLWLQSNSERLKDEAKDAMRDGAHHGSGQPATVCVQEAVRRLDAIDGVIAEARNKVFLEACLKVATLPERFCDGVPPRGELLATVGWASDLCTSLGRPGDQQCGRLVGAVQQRCVGRLAR